MKHNELLLKFQSVFETAIDGIILINTKGEIEEVNDSALGLFGYERADIVGKKVNILMPEHHSKKHDAYVSDYLKTRTPKIIGIGREVEGKKRMGAFFLLDWQ
jgi:PAS domain S-box-containing protein